MKQSWFLVLLLVLTVALAGCGSSKQSSVEGKLVDWNGKPVAGVKITASQVQPIKGYEQFEAVTGTDGTFLLKGLFPSSKYVLKPYSDKWTCETEATVESAPQGETAMLPEPVQIDQAFTKNEPILPADIATGNVARSAVEGKVVDWNGKPVGGIRIVAVQDKPVKGYEQFEKVTNEDGTFRFSELLVSSSYVLKPVSDKWNTEDSMRVYSLPHQGDAVILPESLQIERAFTEKGSLVFNLSTGATRFKVSAEGIITDAATELEWMVGPDQDAGYYAEAVQWVAACTLDGGGWRMPTLEELKALYHPHGERKMDPAFKTTGQLVWFEPMKSSLVCYLALKGGREHCLLSESYGHYSNTQRVFGVRTRP